jgi:hypothetical protein
MTQESTNTLQDKLSHDTEQAQPQKVAQQPSTTQTQQSQSSLPRPIPQLQTPPPHISSSPMPTLNVIPPTPDGVPSRSNFLPTPAPSTPAVVPSTPWSPYATPRDVENGEKGEGDSSKKRGLAEHQELVPMSQKRRRVPAFSTSKKNPAVSEVLNDTTEEEEKEKRVLFILKRAQVT